MLTAMTARYLGCRLSVPLASATPKEDSFPAFVAVLHGCRVCSSSHSVDTFTANISMMLPMQSLVKLQTICHDFWQRCYAGQYSEGGTGSPAYLGIAHSDDGILAGHGLLCV